MSSYTSLNFSFSFHPVYEEPRKAELAGWRNTLGLNLPPVPVFDTSRYTAEVCRVLHGSQLVLRQGHSPHPRQTADFHLDTIGNPAWVGSRFAWPQTNAFRGEYRNAFALVQEEAAKLRAHKAQAAVAATAPYRPSLSYVPLTTTATTTTTTYLPQQQKATDNAFVFHLDVSQHPPQEVVPWRMAAAAAATPVEEVPTPYRQPAHWQHVESPKPIRVCDKPLMVDLNRLAKIELETTEAEVRAREAARSYPKVFSAPRAVAHESDSGTESNMVETPEWPAGRMLPEQPADVTEDEDLDSRGLPKVFTWPGFGLSEEDLQKSLERMMGNVNDKEDGPYVLEIDNKAPDAVFAGVSYQVPIDLTGMQPAPKDEARLPTPPPSADPEAYYSTFEAIRGWRDWVARALGEWPQPLEYID
ncbi:hypothetical protein EVG20_g8222 [Dentipellis fragilis]|uniref:Uncharacterized protein n=1 Tax=Dentipellis fragilis TaxID=205917 RepID=A0A4Y9YBN0_9AGAM|nr:hypothetical protein EVG20_g8222 [Dentipellis fragilis]